MGNVVYLISSLPALSFAQAPPIKLEEFTADAQAQLSSKDFARMQSIDLRLIDTESEPKDLKDFHDMMAEVREDVVAIRKAKAQNQSPSLMNLPQSLVGLNPLEREKQIMQWQWDRLSAIETGETFTFIEVMVYKLKLQILWRLHSFDVERGMQVLSSVVDPPKQEEV